MGFGADDFGFGEAEKGLGETAELRRQLAGAIEMVGQAQRDRDAHQARMVLLEETISEALKTNGVQGTARAMLERAALKVEAR